VAISEAALGSEHVEATVRRARPRLGRARRLRFTHDISNAHRGARGLVVGEARRAGRRRPLICQEIRMHVEELEWLLSTRPA
jgi:hypothetical protein